MSSASLILQAEFEALRAEVVAAYEASGMRASGNWGASVQVELSDNGAAILAPDYINGRKRGSPPPSAAIEQWIKVKGIAARMEKGMTTASLAFLIARKIGKMGWQPKQANIVETVATPERIATIVDKIAEAYLEDFTADVITALNNFGT